MEYKISVQKDRAAHLVKELGNRIEVIEQDQEWTRVKITIESSSDILSIFHAGVMRGVETTCQAFTSKNS